MQNVRCACPCRLVGCIFRNALTLQTLNTELARIDKIYVALEDALQKEVAQIDSHGNVRDKLQCLAKARQSIQETTNFAALNYSAVLKAVKKRNRRLQLACGDSAITAASYDFLADKSFFKSTTLAQVLQSSLSISEVPNQSFLLANFSRYCSYSARLRVPSAAL